MSTETFVSSHPATGHEVGRFPITDSEQVGRTVESAANAAIWWQALGWKARESKLLAWNALLTQRIDEISELISNETGKPVSDARLEATLAIGHLSWAAKHAHKVLGGDARAPRDRRAGRLGRLRRRRDGRRGGSERVGRLPWGRER